MSISRRFCLLLIPAFAPWALGEPLTISDIAPKDAMVVIGVDDFAAARASFDKTGLRKVWDDKSVQAFFKKHAKEAGEELARQFEQSGIKLDELSPPSGPAGAAFWIVWDDKAGKVVPRGVWFGDWGNQAEGVAHQIEEAIGKGEDQKALTVKEDEYAGHKLWILEVVEDAAEAKPAPKAQAGDMESDEPEGDEEEPDAGEGGDTPFELKTIVYARAGNHLVAASDVVTIEAALDRLGGKSGHSVGETAEFTGLARQLGKPQGYAVFFPTPAMGVLNKVIDAAKDGAEGVDVSLGQEPRMTSVIGALGLAGVQGVGVGIKFDTEAGMAEQSFGVLCPDKKGIMSLFAAPERKFEAPAFAPADAAAVSLFQFRAADLLSTLTECAKQLPPEFGDQAVQGIQQAQLMAGPILSNLGPEIWVLTGITRPFNAESSQMLWAIQAKDAGSFNQALQNVAPMVGLQSRDFQGNQVWSMGRGVPIPGLGSLAIGVGFGHVFIGQSQVVENALRQAGNPGAAALDKEERFRKSLAGLKGSGLAFGWTDMGRAIEWTSWMLRNPDKMMESQLSGMFGNDPDAEQYKKEMIENARRNQPEWMKEIPLDVLARELGDSVFEAHSTPEGISGRMIWLRPVAK